MVAVPIATPVTNPVLSTVAFAGSLDTDVTAVALAFAAAIVAVNYCVAPTFIVAVTGLTVTDVAA